LEPVIDPTIESLSASAVGMSALSGIPDSATAGQRLESTLVLGVGPAEVTNARPGR
jgi:hypothetical protein